MQTIHSAEYHRADGRTYGDSWVLPGKRRVKPSSVMQEEMMSAQLPRYDRRRVYEVAQSVDAEV